MRCKGDFVVAVESSAVVDPSVGAFGDPAPRLDSETPRPSADDDLLLARVDGTWLPVREYSREFTAQRKAAGSRQSRSASCGTRLSPGCVRRVSPPMWSLPGMATPNA